MLLLDLPKRLFSRHKRKTIDNSVWATVACNTDNIPVCMKDAISGPAIPDNERPTIPPHVECDTDWEYLKSSQKCYYFDPSDRSWGAASDNCIGMGGQLASINSPTLQDDLFTLSWIDAFALGLRIS